MPPRDHAASSADDRNAIVRAILTALVVATLSLIGAATAFNWAFMAPLRAEIGLLRAEIQESRRSAAAHFGQIKTILKESIDETGRAGGADQ